VFLVLSGTLTAILVHRLAGSALRRGAAWDCGFPDSSPLTQYSASSFSQPLRRVYGATVFGAAETVDMPPPGDLRPARLGVAVHDHILEQFYLRPAGWIVRLSLALNTMQFLTIRRYLVLMFTALIVLMVMAAVRF
jgi:hypothetical protein